MLATSLSENAYPASEILALYRLRWQIELAFKRLKTLLRIDCLPAKTDKGGRSWIYAHLILAIATDACSQDFLDSSPDEMIDADYAPSIWRVQKTVIMVLRIAILGHIALNAVLAAPTRFHRLLAEPPRKRKLQLQYPVRALSPKSAMGFWTTRSCGVDSGFQPRFVSRGGRRRVGGPRDGDFVRLLWLWRGVFCATSRSAASLT